MKYVVAFKMENGLPVASRMIRYSASWANEECKANARFVMGLGWSISLRVR